MDTCLSVLFFPSNTFSGVCLERSPFLGVIRWGGMNNIRLSRWVWDFVQQQGPLMW